MGFISYFQLLDCFTIPTVLFLSWLILKVKYKLVHIVGVLICLGGVGALVGADVLTNKNGAENGKSVEPKIQVQSCSGDY